MNNLTKYALSDLYDIASGISSTKEQAGHGAPFLSFSTVFNNFFLPSELPDLMDTSLKEQEIFSIKEGDVFFTRTSETVDELAMSSVALKSYPCATFSGFLKRLRPKKEGLVYPKFMAFYFRSSYFRKLIDCNTIMTLRASFNEDIFSFLNIYLPDFSVQKKMGDFLFRMEGKIQQNTRINDNLEKQLHTIYDHWFTQFDFPDENGKPYRSSGGKMVWNDELKRKIPDGWEVCSIARYTSIYQPKTISNALFDDNQPFCVYGGGGLIGKYKEYNHKESEVIISCRGNCGNIYYTMPQSWITGNAMVVTPTNSKLSKYYLFDYLDKYGVEKYLSGSVQKQLTRENLSLMPIILPPKFLIDLFNQRVEVIFKDIIRNRREQDCLIKLRDWLLPMLMNGQATVAD